jgi:hypothetical protein
VSHLFLPLQIDLQGLAEIEGREQQEEYAMEIVEQHHGKREYPFLQSLVDLQFLVAKSNAIAVPWKLWKWKRLQTSLTEDNLPQQDNRRWCIKELVEATNSCNEHLQSLSECCGFKADIWEPDSESQIAKFLTALDETVASKSPTDFLKIVHEGIDGFNGQDFQQWLVRLNEVLAQLRGTS